MGRLERCGVLWGGESLPKGTQKETRSGTVGGLMGSGATPATGPLRSVDIQGSSGLADRVSLRV